MRGCCANSTLSSRDFVPGGFDLPEAKGGAAWLDRDTLLLSSALGEDMATSSGYARTVRLWRRGADPLTAPIIFETSADHMAVWADVDRETGEELAGVCRQGRLFRRHRLDRRPHRTQDPHRPADRCLGHVASRLACRQAAHRLDTRRRHLLAGHCARPFLLRLPRRRSPLYEAVRAGRAPCLARVLLVWRPASFVDP